jgi:3-carboxy-cis,cis-muconate cycloisomerase
MAETVEGLEVNPARMAENLDRTKGLILAEAVQMALGSKIGRSVAHELIEKASRKAVAEGKTLGEVLAADKDVRRHLKREEIEHLLDPQHYLGQASAMVDRVLAARKK